MTATELVRPQQTSQQPASNSQQNPQNQRDSNTDQPPRSLFDRIGPIRNEPRWKDRQNPNQEENGHERDVREQYRSFRYRYRESRTLNSRDIGEAVSPASSASAQSTDVSLRGAGSSPTSAITISPTSSTSNQSIDNSLAQALATMATTNPAQNPETATTDDARFEEINARFTEMMNAIAALQARDSGGTQIPPLPQPQEFPDQPQGEGRKPNWKTADVGYFWPDMPKNMGMGRIVDYGGD
jgi:hypothetical protein